jgi:hypothetical protein
MVDSVVVGLQYMYVSIFVSFRTRSKYRKFLRPLFSYLELDFMSLFTSFMCALLRLGCIVLVL